jgi:hypothetical protein
MQLNLRRIDERIQKLQEIRRIAADPELVALLFEFMAAEEERADPVPAARADAAAVGAARLDDAEIVNQVVKGMDLKGMDAQGSGLWSRKRA